MMNILQKTLWLSALLGTMLAASQVFAFEASITFLDLNGNPNSELTVTALPSGTPAIFRDGKYIVEDLPEGSYSLTLATNGYKSYTTTAYYLGPNDRSHDFGSVYAIEATSGYRCSGKVVDEAGSGLADVTVSGAGSTGSVTTDAEGNYQIFFSAAGSHSLNFAKSGYSTTGTCSVTDSAPSRVNSNTILRMQYTLQIKFIDLDANPVSGLTVKTNGGHTATYEEGVYVVSGLLPGAYTLSMDEAGYQPYTSHQVTLNNGKPSHNFSTVYAISATNGYSCQGYVVDKNGQRLAGVTVTLDGQSTTTDVNGAYQISLSTAGNYTLNFTKTDYLTQSAACNVTSGRPISLANGVKLITGYEVSGRVLDIDDNGLAGVTVTIAGKTVTTDANGNYTIVDIKQSGSQTLVLQKGEAQASRTVNINPSHYAYNVGNTYLVDNYLVYGYVKDIYGEAFGEPLAGVEMTVGNQVVTTDADGLYQAFVSDTQNYKVQMTDSRYKPVTTSATVSNSKPSTQARTLYAISATDGYYLDVKVLIPDANVPSSDINITVTGAGGTENITVVPDGNDNFQVIGVTEAGYKTVTVTIEREGYNTLSQNFSITDTDPYKVLNFVFRPGLIITATGTDSVQSQIITYDVQITNPGDAPLKEVEMWSSPPLPEGYWFISAEMIPPLLPDYNMPNNCNITPATRILDCQQLGTLYAGVTTYMEVKVGYEGGPGGGNPFALEFEASGIACLLESCNAWIASQPEITDSTGYINVEVQQSLSVGGESTAEGSTVINPTSVEIGKDLSYTFTIANSADAPADLTNVRLDVAYDEIFSVTTMEPSKGSCQITSNTTLLCSVGTLPPDSKETVTLGFETTNTGTGHLKVEIHSDQLPPLVQTTPPVTIRPPPPPQPPMPVGSTQLMFIIDDTGSMSEELAALVNAVNEYISAYGNTGPATGVVTFKDDYSNRRSATTNMRSVLSTMNSLRAQSGGDCPEASLEALNYAKDLLAFGARIILVTDASPQADSAVDLDALITALRSKGVRVDVILSGEECVGMCGIDTGETNTESVSAIEIFSRLAHETGGMFTTPFEVNDGSSAGATRYQKQALNLMLSTVQPTFTQVTPAIVPPSATLDLTLQAANVSFDDTTTLDIGSNITVNEITVLSPQTLRANVTIAASANLDFYDITATTIKGEDRVETAQGLGLLQIVAASEIPSVVAVSPAITERGGTVTVDIVTQGLTLNGSIAVTFKAAAGITVLNAKATADNTVQATLDLSNAKLGSYSPVVSSNSGETVTYCSMTTSPSTGALLITPALTESSVPMLTSVDPERGAQGALRLMHITAQNTHFEQDVTTLSFTDNKIYVLDLEIISPTEATALLQIDEEASLGFNDVFMYTNDEFAAALDSFEVTAKGEYTVEGYVIDITGEPMVGVTVESGELIAITDETGYYRIVGLNAGEHIFELSKGLEVFQAVSFTLSDNTAIHGDKLMRLPISLTPQLHIRVRPSEWGIMQGDAMTYTAVVTNEGQEMATNIIVQQTVPTELSFVSGEIIGGENCVYNDADRLVTCAIAALATQQTTRIEIEATAVTAGQYHSDVMIGAEQYPTYTIRTWNTVKPYLYAEVQDDRDPVRLGSALFYDVRVNLSHYAAEAEHASNTATGVVLRSYLPAGIRVVSADSRYADCIIEPNGNGTTTVNCQVDDLSIEVGSISSVLINMRVIVEDAGLLSFVHEVRVSANEYAESITRERTRIDIGDPVRILDLAIVMDTTGSMTEEINAVRAEFLAQLNALTGENLPQVALVSFRDDVKLEAFSNNVEYLETALNQLEADGGGSCQEASVEALNFVIPFMQENGVILFATDAAPYEDADMAQLADNLTSSQVKLFAILSGDCVEDGDTAWNDQLFTTP